MLCNLLLTPSHVSVKYEFHELSNAIHVVAAMRRETSDGRTSFFPIAHFLIQLLDLVVVIIHFKASELYC